LELEPAGAPSGAPLEDGVEVEVGVGVIDGSFNSSLAPAVFVVISAARKES
jgi:hypothetical protein